MENGLVISAVVVLALLVGIVVGTYFDTPQEIPACPSLECPDVTCEPVTVTEVVYEECSSEEDLEDDMDELEDELGEEVYEFRTSKTCNDYLEDLGSRWDDRTIRGNAPTELGCVIYYTN